LAMPSPICHASSSPRFGGGERGSMVISSATVILARIIDHDGYWGAGTVLKYNVLHCRVSRPRRLESRALARGQGDGAIRPQEAAVELEPRCRAFSRGNRCRPKCCLRLPDGSHNTFSEEIEVFRVRKRPGQKRRTGRRRCVCMGRGNQRCARDPSPRKTRFRMTLLQAAKMIQTAQFQAHQRSPGHCIGWWYSTTRSGFWPAATASRISKC